MQGHGTVLGHEAGDGFGRLDCRAGAVSARIAQRAVDVWSSRSPSWSLWAARSSAIGRPGCCRGNGVVAHPPPSLLRMSGKAERLRGPDDTPAREGPKAV